MSAILRKCPFFETHTTALVAGGGVTVRPYQIIVWIHRNQAGQRDVFAERPAFCIQLDFGIAVYPEGEPAIPRLPLLGLRGLRRAALQLHVDCRNCRVNLHTAHTFWPF